MKLAEWARSFGVHPQTAYRWFREDRMPVPARRLPSGTIVVDLPDSPGGRAVVYVRVSSHDRRTDLEAQAGRVTAWCATQGIRVDEVVSEVGSGVNGRRATLARLLGDPEVATIVVEYRDRVARFGVEHLHAALAATGRRIVVVDTSETIDDLVGDMVEVLTWMCARLYGRRGARNRAMRAITATKREPGEAAG
ncbi:IS607 family transposase [Solihabitans fulvus]|uniref:IS607 family transposase n=1 Tax=Solihabitans fulvus TaxID=1892852 RepID=A0A5B2WUE2_9PSEU|nr:IS607 family transposase [Solihabitans fulvus]KAA2255381.1 IS607 family transposase [Solihabitans fulvus]